MRQTLVLFSGRKEEHGWGQIRRTGGQKLLAPQRPDLWRREDEEARPCLSANLAEMPSQAGENVAANGYRVGGGGGFHVDRAHLFIIV